MRFKDRFGGSEETFTSTNNLHVQQGTALTGTQKMRLGFLTDSQCEIRRVCGEARLTLSHVLSCLSGDVTTKQPNNAEYLPTATVF